MLSQLPELQPAIPSSFLGIARAALLAGTGGMSQLQQEKGEALSCEFSLGVTQVRWEGEQAGSEAAGLGELCSILGSWAF